MSAEKKFYLGVGGQQTGPHSENEIKDRIAVDEIKSDDLIWYEGLGEWQRVDTIAYFQASFRKNRGDLGTSAVMASTAVPLSNTTEKLRPVFSEKEAVFFRRRGPRPEVAAGGIVLLVLGLGLFWYLGSDEQTIVLDRAEVSKSGSASRYLRWQKADGEFLRNPNIIPPDFKDLIKEDPKDELARKSIATLEDTYKKRRMLSELAGLYGLVGRHDEAAQVFLELKAYSEAYQAEFNAYEQATDPGVRAKFLSKAIEIALHSNADLPKAIESIRLLETNFPKFPHPFGYYLLSPEKKMVDIFDRVSYFFVENLVNHLKAEFPQLKLAKRPTASIRKEGPDRFRVVGSYQGEVSLSFDRLKNIRFEYWLSGNEWNLVNTNLTVDREAWAKRNRARQGASSLSGAEMLVYLENLMRNQFPGQGVHEKISQDELSSAARGTASASQ
jgi:hypothetical protein